MTEYFSTELAVITDNNNCSSMLDFDQAIQTKEFQTINIEFSMEQDIKKPKINNDGNFYIIYSPEKIKLRPRDSIMLNLQLKGNLPQQIEATVGLLPTFVSRKLSMKNSSWISNKRKDKTIYLDISNKDFYNATNISENKQIFIKSKKLRKDCYY